MSVVFITIPGNAKRDFANALSERTEGGLQLVILQKSPKKPIIKKLFAAIRYLKWRIFVEAWYALLLRLDGNVRKALSYFGGSAKGATDAFVVETMEVSSVNSDEVYEALQKISPDLLVVWGSAILSPKILSTAKRAINLHLGYCPYYRGALANHCAVLDGELTKIGATVHFINSKADAGDILAVIPADAEKLPQEMFDDLHTEAASTYLSIASALNRGEELPSTPQDISISKNFFLRDWVPSLRYKVGKRILAWEEKMTKR